MAQKIREESTAVANAKDGWDDYFTTLKENNQDYIVDLIKNTDDLSKLTGEDLVKANQKARESAIAHNAALKQQTLSAKAGKVALQGLATVGNMLATWAISEAISLAVKGIDNLVHRVEIAKEKAEQAKETISDLQSTYESHKKTVEECAGSYEKFAKGVDTASNKTLNLSDDDYKEYCDTVNKIAEAFPALAKTVDENGVAILNFADNTKTASENLQEFLDKEEKTANLKIAQSLPDLFGGIEAYKTELDDAKSTYDDLNEDIEALNKLSNGIKNGENVFFGTGDYSNIYNVLVKAVEKYRKYLIETGEEMDAALNPEYMFNVQNGIDGEYRLSFNVNGITDFDKLSEYVSEAANEASGTIQDAVGDAQTVLSDAGDSYDTAWKDFTGNLVNAMHSKATYFSLDPVSQQLADSLVSNLSADVASEMDEKDPYKWIQENIISQLSKIGDSEQKQLLLEKFQKLLSFEDGDLDVLSLAEELKKIFSELGIKIDLTPIIGNEKEAKEKLGNSLDSIVGKNKADKKELNNYTKDFTASEIDLWLKATNGAKSAEEAIKSYEDELDNLNSKLGETEAPSFTSAISQVQSLSKGLDQLDKIYADVYDKEEFDWSSILNNDDFKEAFGSMANVTGEFKSAYDDFIETVSNSPDDIGACQDAFDSLATAYIYDSDALKGLSEETKGATIEMLEQMGIANAEELVSARLAAQTAFLTEKKNNAAIASDNLNDATWQELSAVAAEGEASEETRMYLANLALAKLDITNNPIDTKADVDAICAIANAAGMSAEYVNSLKAALLNLQVSTGANALVKAGLEAVGKESGVDLTKGALDEVDKYISGIQDSLKGKIDPADFYAKYEGGSATKSAAEKATKEAEKEAEKNLKYYDLIEIAIGNIQRRITSLGKTVSAAYLSWGRRNSALLSEMSEVRSEIGLQQEAYERYMAVANSFGLPDYYKNLIMNGGMDIISTDDEDLQEQIDSFKEYYEKAIDCRDAVEDLRGDLADLAKTRFDSISSEFDDIISQIEHSSDMIEGKISQVEEQGYIAGTVYYENLINTELENLGMLQKEYSSLNSLLNSGDIEVYSESWYEMKSAINDVEKAIQDSNTAIIQFKNNIRDLKWEVFDKTRNAVSDITDESDFLIDLLSNKKLFEDNGNLNNYGQSVVGLHAVKFNTYMRQSDDYAKEIARIDKELANDPYNDKLLERRQELVDAQRDMISAAEDEKQAIKELVSNSYDAMLDALQKIIDKRKEALQAEKDLYDYQKSVAEQSKTITSLEKQIVSYNGDDSEETRATIQKLKVSLEEAKSDLAETEYEKWVSDQEAILDELYSEAEQFFSSRLDDLDAVIRESIEATNANAETISSTINAEANNVGITLTDAMNNIWSGSDGLKPIVTEYIQTFKEESTKVKASIDAIAQKIQANIDEANRRAQEEANRKAQEEAQAPAPTTPTSQPSQPSSNSGNSGSGSWGSWFVSKKDSYPKDKLNKDGSIVDRLKWKDIDSSFSARAGYYSAMGGSGTYTGSASQNTWMLQQMKAHGYRKGTKSATKGWHLTDEEGFGSEIIATKDGVLRKLDGGETIFNKDMVRNLWNLASGNIMNPIANIPTPNIVKNTDTSRNVSVDLGKTDINMYGVNDLVKFQEQLVQTMKNSTKVEKIIQDMTLGNALGANSLSKYRR